MPKLWSETIVSHRREVREAVLAAAVRLVSERGLRAVTMSEIADASGIGRATLYKYFDDVESILFAWHEEKIASHLEHLRAIRNGKGSPLERLRAILEVYAHIQRQHHATELVALLHRGKHVARAQRRLEALLSDLLAEGVREKQIRKDIAPRELATFCLHALTAAGALRSDGVPGLLAVTIAGLRSSAAK
jgi:AcrR family transcriptional regulator